jgi:di/tricarboxylate transporter
MVAMEAKCIVKASAQTSCKLGFAEWMYVSVPFGVAMLIASYIAIIVAYRPSVARVSVVNSGARVLSCSREHNVTCLTLVAAALWRTVTFVSPYFGSLGAIGLIPVIVLPPHLHYAMRHMTHAAPPAR